MARDGGYRGIVVNVGEDIPEEECAVLVENIKVTPSQVDIITITSPWWPHGHESKPGYPQQRQHCDSDNTAILGGKYVVFPTSAAPTYENILCKKPIAENINPCSTERYERIVTENLVEGTD